MKCPRNLEKMCEASYYKVTVLAKMEKQSEIDGLYQTILSEKQERQKTEKITAITNDYIKKIKKLAEKGDN